MTTPKPTIIRKYQRQSKSKWREHDDSTILLLATIEDKASLTLKYDRFIYLHRDNVGRWLGISLSSSLQDELEDDKGKYRDGLDMLEVLLKYHHEILVFLEHFTDEFESIFGIDAFGWLEAAELRWYTKLRKAERISDS